LFSPFVRRLDNHLDDHLSRVVAQLRAWNSEQRESLRELELLGDSMVREMARLQAQIAVLEANLYEASRPPEQPLADAEIRSLAPRQPSSRAA
jgi:hypothetical protein